MGQTSRALFFSLNSKHGGGRLLGMVINSSKPRSVNALGFFFFSCLQDGGQSFGHCTCVSGRKAGKGEAKQSLTHLTYLKSCQQTSGQKLSQGHSSRKPGKMGISFYIISNTGIRLPQHWTHFWFPCLCLYFLQAVPLIGKHHRQTPLLTTYRAWGHSFSASPVFSPVKWG